MDKRIKKLLNSWQHFGTAMMLSKAWDKFVIEPYRFRTGLIREVPKFPPSPRSEVPTEPLNVGSRIRVCYLLHYFFPDKQGGTERFVLNLAKSQQQIGNEVCVITLGKRTIKEYSQRVGDIFFERFYVDGIPVIQMRYRRAPRGLYYDEIDLKDPTMVAFAKEIIHQYRPNVVHFAYPQPFASFAAECRRCGIPYVVTLTDFNIFCHYATLVKKDGTFCAGSCEGANCSSCQTYGVKDSQSRFSAAKEMLAYAAYVTVPSGFVADVMSQEFKEFCLIPYVIPHGISTSFAIQKMRTRTRRIIYAGTLAPLKGVSFLLQAFKKLKRNVTLCIYGGGASGYIHSLKKIAKDDERITFCGEVSPDQMSKIYQEADCVVVPSLWFETYNFVLREALASGCLGVVSGMGAMPEAVIDGENGFVFRAGDEKSLLMALEKACDFNWHRYAQQAFPRIEDEANCYAALYHNCLNGQCKE